MRRLVVVTRDILPSFAQAPLFEKEGRGGDFLTSQHSTYEPKDSLPNLPYPLFAKEGNRLFANLKSVDKGQILTPFHTEPIPFSNAKTLLGQELPYAIYDMRAENGICLNLEALAILAGTIQENGTLYLLCPQWHKIENLPDMDALRWNANQAVSCPNFYTYFKQLVAEFQFEIVKEAILPHEKRDNATQNIFSLTSEQQHILEHLPISSAHIHLITAPRGRGKSTISGKLAEKIAQTYPVIITARSHSALPNFWKGIKSEQVHFFAPDRLLQHIKQQQISANHWLFIDEAASLPLPILHQFCAYFEKVVLTTTTQNYEGTGRGFSLKFLPKLNRSHQHWQLTQPLRWGEDDQLESFVNRLLLLEEQPKESILPLLAGEVPCEARGRGQDKRSVLQKNLQMPPSVSLRSTTSPASRGRILASDLIPFYHLLAQAHYKTTPTDLRRLFDGSQQYFSKIKEDERLIAGAWLLEEGGLDSELAQAIWRGERRPPGNLVAQYLCFQGNLIEACQLRSVRISRIAVQPELQQQGYGKRLVLQIFSQIDPLVDFVSVSFGMGPELLKFWQDCGFELVQITPTIEASSGYPSAMMLYPLTSYGKQFVKQAIEKFARDLPLQPFFYQLPSSLQKMAKSFPLAHAFLEEDRQNLEGFISAQRSFSGCFVSLKRLYLQSPNQSPSLKMLFEQWEGQLPYQKQMWLKQLRREIQFIQVP